MSAAGVFIAAAVVLIGGAACGGGGGGGGDAGPWTLSETGVRLACDPGAQDCPSGQTCDFLCDDSGGLVACRPVGGVAVGEACSVPAMCAAASGCYATATMGQSCVKYCRSNEDCALGTCQERQVFRACPAGRALHVARFCLP